MQIPTVQFTKTRIAPTPSGYLHLGNVLSFALTASLAKQTGAKTLLRIDDLDRQRANKLYVQDIFDTLNFLEIPWDEGPRNLQEYESGWSQVHRMAFYQSLLQQLKESGEVFACQCSRVQIQSCTCRNKAIPLDAPDTSWRLITNKEKEITVNTLNNGIIKTTLPAALHNFVVKKKDGYPSYQLTSLADDLHYGVDLVVRGEDLWPSTMAQHYLAGVLKKADFSKTTFHHHPLIVIDGEKLSKSAGATSVRYLREHDKTETAVYKEIGRMMGIDGDLRSFENFFNLV